MGLWRDIPIGDVFVERATEFGPRVAVVDGARSVTYAELLALTDRLAGHLVARELHRGAAVILQLPNVLEFVVAYFACLRVGAIPICCLPSHRRAEITAFARLAQARAWIGPAALRGFDYLAMVDEVRAAAPSLSEAWVVGGAARGTASFEDILESPSGTSAAAVRAARPRPDDLAALLLSGGTTGTPKLVPRTHNDYLCYAEQGGVAKAIERDTVLLCALPVAHTFALSAGVQSALLVGARVVLAPTPSPSVVMPLIGRERVTWVSAVPATLLRWTEAAGRRKHDLRTLRVMCVGGQRLGYEPARAAVEVFGPIVRQAFGMAEGLSFFTHDGDPDEAHLLYQGRPLTPADEVRVVDENGHAVPPGELGELQGRGPTVIRGYYRAAKQNAVAFTTDGFYCTGDIVRILPSGYLVVEGRKKDMINRGGEKISAEELESFLLAHEAVAACAVVSVPDPELGERACACLVLRPGRSLGLPELTTYLTNAGIAAFKIPERVELFDELPLTGVGKISKQRLRDAVASRGT
jgi:2,3-dihydroxybenzoate-AMP ligase